MMITPIKYNGCKFASRLHAIWAAFFDRIGEAWEYVSCYQHGVSGPAFYLPRLRVYILVVHDTIGLIGPLNGVAEAIAYSAHVPVCVAVGFPSMKPSSVSVYATPGTPEQFKPRWFHGCYFGFDNEHLCDEDDPYGLCIASPHATCQHYINPHSPDGTLTRAVLHTSEVHCRVPKDWTIAAIRMVGFERGNNEASDTTE